MTLTANYARSCYAGIEYAVRGAASYTGNTSDAVTGGDGLAAVAYCIPSTSDTALGGDGIVANAVCSPATADAVTGGDNAAALAAFLAVTADGITGNDFLNAIAAFYDECLGEIMALDGSISRYFRPVNIFALEKEKRKGLLIGEMRETAAHTRKQAEARRENRTTASVDGRNTAVKSDNRNFEI